MKRLVAIVLSFVAIIAAGATLTPAGSPFYTAAVQALSGLTPAADTVPYFTSTTAASTTSFTSVARTLVGQSSQATMRSTGLGLDTLTQPLVNYGGLNFNGTTTYIDGNALTGIADGKKGTFFAIVRFANAASAVEYLWQSTGDALQLFRTATGNIEVTAENAGGTQIMRQLSSGNPLSAAGTYVIMASWDLAVPGSFRLYINDVAATINAVTYTDDTIDYTVAENSIGASVSGGSRFTGDMYVVWFDATTAQDFSSAAVRRKFTDVNNVPQYLGRNCELPTGSTPILCLAYDSAAQWPVNRGSAQSTAFTQNGAIAAAGTVLYGQWAPLENRGTIKTVTADYTVLATDKTIINNRAATNTLTLPAAGSFKNRTLRIVTIQAQAVNSASSNVVPRAGGAAGTAILGASDGAWVDLESDGTNWISTAGSFLDPQQFLPWMLHEHFAANDSTYLKAA